MTNILLLGDSQMWAAIPANLMSTILAATLAISSPGEFTVTSHAVPSSTTCHHMDGGTTPFGAPVAAIRDYCDDNGPFDVTFILLGTNDSIPAMNCGTPSAVESRNNMRTIARRAKAHGCGKQFVLSNPPITGGLAAFVDDFRALLSVTKNRYVLLDLHGEFVGGPCTWNPPDGVHPGPVERQCMADFMAAEVED